MCCLVCCFGICLLFLKMRLFFVMKFFDEYRSVDLVFMMMMKIFILMVLMVLVMVRILSLRKLVNINVFIFEWGLLCLRWFMWDSGLLRVESRLDVLLVRLIRWFVLWLIIVNRSGKRILRFSVWWVMFCMGVIVMLWRIWWWRRGMFWYVRCFSIWWCGWGGWLCGFWGMIWGWVMMRLGGWMSLVSIFWLWMRGWCWIVRWGWCMGRICWIFWMWIWLIYEEKGWGGWSWW